MEVSAMGLVTFVTVVRRTLPYTLMRDSLLRMGLKLASGRAAHSKGKGFERRDL